ncbi:MAG: hypothetical protein QOF61_3453 [Acidobacteriota bacterium]|jgi:hypothetical protein|nr:hypothetical protein [Acidobacteriota bacterium]
MTRALVIFLLIISAAPRALAADPPRDTLSASSRTRAEKLLAELATLDVPPTPGVSAFDARRAGKVAAQVYVRAQGLPDGDLKTDLATAARFYERAFTRELVPRDATPDASNDAVCGRERPGAYRRLCAALSGRDMISLLLAKGRLHAGWARALVADRADASVVASTLEEMRAERVLDAVLARQALVALRELEATVNAPPTLADFEAERRIGKVSPAEFSRLLDAASRVVKQSLAWLPESPLKCEIENAFHSYADGLWWWQRTDRPLVVKVAGNKFAEQDFAAMSHLPDVQLGYNAIVNLRHARDYTRHAEALLDAELSRVGLKMAKN